MSDMKHVQRGFGSVRPYLCGPTSLTAFIQGAFSAELLETNEGGPALLKLGDSLLWVEASELPAHIEAWVGSVYVYVPDVDAVCARAMELGARSISEPEDKPYNERQTGFVDVGGNTWWVSTYLGHAGSLKHVVAEMERALELLKAYLAQYRERQSGWSLESAVLQCRDRKRFWEVHARQPHSASKLVLHVQMDGTVREAGVISNG